MIAVCAGVAIATTVSTKTVVYAAETQTASFALTQGASIRDGAAAGDGFYGLRFETTINKAWLDANKADKYWYGTLIFPAKNIGAFDDELGSTANKENLQAVKIISGQGEALTNTTTYYASVVYDRATIAELYGLESLTNPQYEKITKNLYAMDMTAISYIQYGDKIIYSAPYTDSMIKVAARLQSDPVWAEKAQSYLGSKEIETIKTYAVDDDNIVKGFDVQESSISQVVIGNETLTNGIDYTIENGALTLNAQYVKQNKGIYEDIFHFYGIFWGINEGFGGKIVHFEVNSDAKCVCFVHPITGTLWKINQFPRRDLQRSVLKDKFVFALGKVYQTGGRAIFVYLRNVLGRDVAHVIQGGNAMLSVGQDHNNSL